MHTVYLTIAAVLLASSGLAASQQGMDLEDLPDPGTTRLAAPEVRIEMDLSSRRPSIEVLIDGEGPFQFVVDTGAALTVVDSGIADRLGLEVVGEQVLHSPGSSEGVHGNRVQARRVQAGGLVIESPVMATMDLVAYSGGVIEGVLGRPHFRDLLWTLDYPSSELVLSQGRLTPSDPGVLAFDLTSGSIRFPAVVDGRELPMVLDSGSPGGFTLPKKLESELTFRSELVAGPSIRLVGGTHPSWRGSLDGTVQLGKVSYENPDVLLTTFADGFGNIGFSVLEELAVTIDQASGLIRFERKPMAATGSSRIAKQDGADASPAPGGGPVRMAGPSGQPRLGVAFQMTPGGFVKEQGGLIVRSVDQGGAAERAGLAVGDVLLAVGETAVAEVEGVMELAGLLRAPRPLEMTILRGEEERTIVVE